jgi:hypothetical protein
LNTTPSPLLPTQFTIRYDLPASQGEVKQRFLQPQIAVKKMTASKKNPFPDSASFCGYLTVKDSPVIKLIIRHVPNPTAHAAFFAAKLSRLKLGRG